MHKILLSLSVALALGTLSTAGHAADSATFSVTGTISPTSCDVSLSAEKFDFGSISAATLTAMHNEKAGSAVNLNVTCDAATALAVQTTDNRASSAMTGADMEAAMSTITSLNDASLFGLGTDSDGNKIGVMLLVVSNATLNGAVSSNLLTSDDKAAWSTHSISLTSPFPVAKNSYFALASDAGSTVPAAVTNVSYTLRPGIILKRADKYPGGETVNIDGNVTFSLVYL